MKRHINKVFTELKRYSSFTLSHIVWISLKFCLYMLAFIKMVRLWGPASYSRQQRLLTCDCTVQYSAGHYWTFWTLREAMWLAWQAWCGEKTVRLRNCQIVSEGERGSGTGIPLTTQCLLDDLWDLIPNHGWWTTDSKLQRLSNPIQAKLTPTLILTLRRSMSRPIWPTMKSSVWR